MGPPAPLPAFGSPAHWDETPHPPTRRSLLLPEGEGVGPRPSPAPLGDRDKGGYNLQKRGIYTDYFTEDG